MIVFLLREKTSHRIIDERKQLHGLKGRTDFCGFVHFLFTVPDKRSLFERGRNKNCSSWPFLKPKVSYSGTHRAHDP